LFVGSPSHLACCPVTAGTDETIIPTIPTEFINNFRYKLFFGNLEGPPSPPEYLLVFRRHGLVNQSKVGFFHTPQ
jgi:hypothetical protein